MFHEGNEEQCSQAHGWHRAHSCRHGNRYSNSSCRFRALCWLRFFAFVNFLDSDSAGPFRTSLSICQDVHPKMSLLSYATKCSGLGARGQYFALHEQLCDDRCCPCAVQALVDHSLLVLPRGQLHPLLRQTILGNFPLSQRSVIDMDPVLDIS